MNMQHGPHTSQQADCSRRWWHSSLIGYPATLLLTGGALLIPWSERGVGIHDFFIAPPFVIVTLLVGWFWGVGPALLALLLEVFVLDYWIIPPLGTLDFFQWPDLASFGPFIIIQLVALGLILVQKRYRHQLFLSNRAMARYVEELLEINRQLEQANHCRDLFVSQASHELKTPLTTVRGLVQLTLRRLLREPPLPTNYSFLQAHLERLEVQTHRLHTLVDDLLSLSYLRSGNVRLRVAPCDLNRLCREVIGDLGPLTDHEIDLKCFSDPIELQADEERLSQVVLNLVNNALKYSPAHTLVQVEVNGNRGEALLTVHNDGSFLSPEQQEQIFEPFYRAPEVWCSTISGWGLGLAISKQLVEQHRGRIWVESSETHGTTFWVALPFV